MHALRAGETGSLRVATYQSIGARVLPAVMRRFLAEWPGINLGLSEPSVDPELYTLIESGDLDLAFCSLPVPDGPFEAIELMTDPYVLARPRGHTTCRERARRRCSISVTCRSSERTCAPAATSSRPSCVKRGFTVDYAFRSDDNTTIQGLVAAHFGVALMPLLAVQQGDDRVKALRLLPAVPRRQIAVVWHKDRHRTPAARAFVEIAREVSAAVERSSSSPEYHPCRAPLTQASTLAVKRRNRMSAI